MNLLEALAATDTDKGPRSNLEKYLADVEGTSEGDAVTVELEGARQAAHLARAITMLARKRGTIAADSSVSGQSVTRWRAAHGS